MPFRVVSRHLRDQVVVLESTRFEDDRGFFMETYRRDEFERLGLPGEFVQDNFSRSHSAGIIRGLHFQLTPPQGKLFCVTRGRAFLVAVDIGLPASPTLGQWFGITLGGRDGLAVWAPAGFARGFCTLAPCTEVAYKCTAFYNPPGEGAILWNDPVLAIRWPVDTSIPRVSQKDHDAQSFYAYLKAAGIQFYQGHDLTGPS